MNTYLQIRELTKRYGSICALEDINLELERGQVLALLGPNGAGKSTLFGCLLGFTQPTAGEIFLNGCRITDAQRTAFGYAAERIAVYANRSVKDNAAFFAALKGFSPAEAERQLARVGLGSLSNSKVRQLSKGMLQRLGLAIALCGGPDLLVLDEPFNGLDPAQLRSLQGILREEQSRGATLLISTHTMLAIEPLATRVAVLLAGKLVAFKTLDQLRADHLVPNGSLEAIYHEIALDAQPLQEALA